MDQIRHWLSFIIMMFSILFNTMDAALLTKAPEAKSEQELVEMSEKFDEYELADEITVIKASVLSDAQRHAVIALQGLVARDNPQIFIDFGYATNTNAINELEKAGYKIVRNDESGNLWNFKTIVEKFKSYIDENSPWNDMYLYILKLIEIVRKKHYGKTVRAFTDVDTIANGLVVSHFENDNLFSEFKVLQEITADYCFELLKNSFDKEKAVLSVVKPKEI